MLKSRLNEASFHIADGSFRGNSRNVISWPTFTQGNPEHVEVRIALSDLKAAFHVISQYFIRHIVIVLHGFLDDEFLPTGVAGDLK